MSDKSKIQWTNFTLNFLVGCTKVSAGCDNCYAIVQSHSLERRFESKKYTGLTVLNNEVLDWTGELRLIPELIEKPLHMTKPRKIFVNSMSDLFHEKILTDNTLWNAVWKFFGVMLKADHHEYQILTKRPHIMRDFVQKYLFQNGMRQLPKHIWLGTSVENQKVADVRIPKLLQIPGGTKWLSMEPLLEAVGISLLVYKNIDNPLHKLDWVVIGGESGTGARIMRDDWLYNLKEECLRFKIPLFIKQLGSVRAKELKLNDRKGGDIEEFPAIYKIRQFPNLENKNYEH